MAMTLLRIPCLAATLLVVGLVPLAAQDEPDTWDIELEFGLNGASGNSDFTILRAGASATRIRTRLYELDFSTVVRYGTNEDRVIANDARASVKFDWRPQATWSPFVFVDASRDEIRRVDFQADGGLGAKWTFLRRDRGDASLSLATLFEYQNFDLPEDDEASPESTSLVRWSLRFKADRTLGEGTELEHVTFYKPVVDDAGDYVVEVTNTLSTELLENLTLAMEHLYLRDNVPPPGATRDDQKFSIIFRLGL